MSPEFLFVNLILHISLTNFPGVLTTSTNPSDWEDLVSCPNHPINIVTGFQLKFDYHDPSNPNDKTVINGISVGCGRPYQSEQTQEHNTIWINGAGNSSVFGYPERKFFCDGYTIGFRLRIHANEFPHHDFDGQRDGVKNVRMICENGEELEGHEDKLDYYPEAEYTNQSLKCPEGMAVCGIQTQMAEVNLVGGVSTSQLNDLRIFCCSLPESSANSDTSSVIEVATTESNYEYPFTPSPRHIDVTLFSSQGESETISIKSGECNSIPENWQGSLVALEQKSVCVRLWETKDCNGNTRCYCDSDILRLDETFKMSNNSSWEGNVRALTPCFLEYDRGCTRILIFSGKNYTGELQGSVILQLGECLTFYEGDRWNNHNHIASLIVTDGCLEYFDDEECKGNSKQLEGPENELSKEWERNVKSIRSCSAA